MSLLIICVLSALAEDMKPSTQIWMGLKAGLQKEGKPGECLAAYPKTVEAYKAFEGSLESTDLSPKLHSFQIFFSEFNEILTICKLESLFSKIFGIYQWDVLRPILTNLAGNLTYFLLLVNYFLLAITNGFYYNIGFYMGEIVQLVFTYSI